MYQSLAEIYDAFAQDIDYDRWTDDLLSLLRRYAPGKRVAELACGTAAIGCRLAKAGFTVTGIDVSPEMLRKAEEKVRQFGAQLPLSCQDIRQFSLHRPADAILCPCDGVNYLTGESDLDRWLSRCKANLVPGGLLIFDVSTPEKLRRMAADGVYYDLREDSGYIWQNRLDGNLLEMDLTVFLQGADGRYQRIDETQRQRLYEKEELLRHLSDFSLISAKKVCYNKENTDDRLQVVCTHPK